MKKNIVGEKYMAFFKVQCVHKVTVVV